MTREKAQQAAQAAHLKLLKTEIEGVDPNNQCRVLLDIPMEEETRLRSSAEQDDVKRVVELDTTAVQAIHDRWGHPSETKMAQIVKYYKEKGFPPGFMKALRHFKCKICGICKGHRNYRHTKRVVEKLANHLKHGKNKKVLETVPNLNTNSSEDNFTNAFAGENDLHINYAHSIALGYHQERYCLVFIVGR